MTTGKRPLILFVADKWADSDPRRGPANNHHNLFATLDASGLAERREFFVDEFLLQNAAPYDEALVRECETARPDALVISLARGVKHHARPETLDYLGRELGIKRTGLFPDTFARADAARIERFAPALDLVVLQDSYTEVLAALSDTAKVLPAWTPQDPAVFYDDGSPRDVEVAFLGSIARYPDRKLGLGVLAAAGVEVLKRGGHGEDPMAIADYGALLRRSRIVLNFAHPVFDEPGWQCKGRVFEATLSGALLMEQANPETRRWFDPGIHYVEFANERELVEKARAYLADEGGRRAIAEAGHAHAAARYGARSYWSMVLSRVGLACP